MLKKTLITSSAMIVAGALIISSVSANSNESDNKPTVTTYEASGSVEGTATVSNSGMTQQEMRDQMQKQQEVRQQEMQKKNQEMKDQIEAKNQEIQKQQETRQQEMKDQTQAKQDEMRNKVQVKRVALSEKLHTQLVAIIEKLSIDKLTRVLGNINKAVVKVEASNLDQVRKDNLLAQLEEIRVIIQDKVDALNGVAPAGINLNDLLNGITPETATGTTTVDTTATGTVTATATGTTVNTTATGTGTTP